MKFFLVLLFLIKSVTAADLPPNQIIPRFYELLMQNDNPSEFNETEFFGGDECKFVTTTLKLKDDYKNSKTPIWDFLRRNKNLFITEGVSDLNKAKIHHTDPVITHRLWNSSTWEEKSVHVLFPTEMNTKTASSGFSTVIFRLGQKCYINIAGTMISGQAYSILDKIYENRDKKPVDSLY